jgi:hypothetical protein
MPAPQFPELPDEYLKEIAKVAVRWNFLESYLTLFLMYLFGKDVAEDRSQIIFAHLSFPQKVDALGALGEHTANDPDYANVQRCHDVLLPLLAEAQTKRNEYLHSVWRLFPDGTVSRNSIKARRGGLKFLGTVTPLNEIREAVASIQKAIDTIVDLASPAWTTAFYDAVQRHKEYEPCDPRRS